MGYHPVRRLHEVRRRELRDLHCEPVLTRTRLAPPLGFIDARVHRAAVLRQCPLHGAETPRCGKVCRRKQWVGATRKRSGEHSV